MVRGWFPRPGQRHTTTKKKLNIRFFRLNTLRIATNNFSTLLGHGGFGSVFKGVLPDDKTTVAIKRNTRPHDGFLEMVEFTYHLRHINLIQVIGCCVENGEQILVCEYAENSSLSEYLHDENKPAFDWESRTAVCIGTARGLCYLHEEINPRVIHRDIKPANILLDANFKAKIADFDLLYVVDGNLCVKGGKRTNVKGTLGYLDPNYVLKGELTEKVDVYSFGLVMLEIITGRRAVDMAAVEKDDQMILSWVTRVRKQGMVLKIVDPKLTEFPKEDVERFINIALMCTRATPELRPSMFEVVHMIYGRHKSDQEISEMATGAIADQPVSMSSMYESSTGFDCAADMQPREESDESSIVSNIKDDSWSKGESSSSKAELMPEETRFKDLVRDYYERSMEKIYVTMRSNTRDRTRITSQTTVMNKSSETMFMEAVYPPFLSGEYRTSRVLYSKRPAPL